MSSQSRRSVLKTAGAGFVVGGLFSTSAGARSDTFTQQLNTVRAATRKYRDVQTARDDGYTKVSPYVPGMGIHFENVDLIASDENEAPDLEAPAVVLYVPNGSYRPAPFSPHDPERDDDLNLAAAEFVHDGTPGAAADYFDDENATRRVKTPESAGWGQIPGTDHTGLHVWVHRGNPDGVFAPFNKTVP